MKLYAASVEISEWKSEEEAIKDLNLNFMYTTIQKSGVIKKSVLFIQQGRIELIENCL